MNTKKMLALIALASGALITTSPSYAGSILIDDFSASQKKLQDRTVDGSAVSDTLSGVRTLSDNLLSSGNGYYGRSSVVVEDGILEIKNRRNSDSEIIVSWVLDKGLFTGATSAEFNLSIIGNAKTSLEFLLDNNAFASFTIDTDNSKSLNFALDSSQLATMDIGGNLALKINGAPGWDLKLDQIGVNVANSQSTNIPEPTLMGLLGISLTGLGFFHRKNRS